MNYEFTFEYCGHGADGKAQWVLCHKDDGREYRNQWGDRLCFSSERNARLFAIELEVKALEVTA